tara:strand:+ start:3607 stop:3792 length:186 start_codon:yes stop_codon:yes gene_type:complete
MMINNLKKEFNILYNKYNMNNLDIVYLQIICDIIITNINKNIDNTNNITEEENPNLIYDDY